MNKNVRIYFIFVLLLYLIANMNYCEELLKFQDGNYNVGAIS